MKVQFDLKILVGLTLLLEVTGCGSVPAIKDDPALVNVLLRRDEVGALWHITDQEQHLDCDGNSYERVLRPFYSELRFLTDGVYRPLIIHTVYDCSSVDQARSAWGLVSIPAPGLVPATVGLGIRLRHADEQALYCGELPDQGIECQFAARYGHIISLVRLISPPQTLLSVIFPTEKDLVAWVQARDEVLSKLP